MSPGCRDVIDRDAGFPRVSGDEPDKPSFSAMLSAFSPRERG